MKTPSHSNAMEKLPPSIPVEQLESREVLKKLNVSKSALAELKGIAGTIPNEQILIDALSLQEAKDSSEIENIVTTHDELYQSNYRANLFSSPEAKEVYSYAEALKVGFQEVKAKGIITKNIILTIQEIIEGNNAGIRRQPGTQLKNDLTGEVIYEPPQDYEVIMELLDNLEWFMNQKEAYETDPLIKMALIHHQFESIHPFYDGNGRTGRILNILYLVLCDLLPLPILYISHYIIRNRQAYYTYLQQTRETGHWEPWILYMLEAIEVTSKATITKINGINQLMQEYKHKLKDQMPRIYSQDLINNLFRHPYTRISWIKEDLNVSRLTATKYLDKLVEMNMLEEVKKGRNKYYVNARLFALLKQ